MEMDFRGRVAASSPPTLPPRGDWVWRETKQGKGKGSEQENGDEGGKGWGGLKMLLVHER